jgi:hypothetical protein
VTRERIRQIESKTLAKLRHPSRAQMLSAPVSRAGWRGEYLLLASPAALACKAAAACCTAGLSAA